MATNDDPVRGAIHADRRTRRFESRRGVQRTAREELLASLNSAPGIRSLLTFASLLRRVARQLAEAGIRGHLANDTTLRRVGRELLDFAREHDIPSIARLVHRRLFQFYEPLKEDSAIAGPRELVDRIRRGQVVAAYKLVKKYLEDPDLNKANWVHVEGVHYLRVGFWHAIGELAGFEEENGRLFDAQAPLTADDPGLPFPTLCKMAADDLRAFLTARATDPLARVPRRVRRNIDRVRMGSAGNSRINETPIELSKASTETILSLIEELDRLARVTAYDGTPPPAGAAEEPSPERARRTDDVATRPEKVHRGWKEIMAAIKQHGIDLGHTTPETLRAWAKDEKLPVTIDPKGGRPRAWDSALKRWCEEALRGKEAAVERSTSWLDPVERAAEEGGTSFARSEDAARHLEESDSISRRARKGVVRNDDGLSHVTRRGQSRR